MLLATVAQLRDTLGFDAMADINAAVMAALNAADVTLQARIGTPFAPATITDTFYVEEPSVMRGVNVQTEFRLSQGFVQTVTSAKYADTLAALDSDFTSVLADLIVVSEKGVLRDFTTPYSRNFIRVAYTAGFVAEEGDATSYKAALVPGWLNEAAQVLALLYLAGHPTLEQAQIKLDTKMLRDQYETLVSSKVRYAPAALLPL